MTETATDFAINKESSSGQYKIFSTDSDKLLSNFSFAINKDITIIETGELDSINKPTYTLYYPRTRDEFEINIYIVNFGVTVFASAASEVYAAIKNYENLKLALKENKQGKIVPSTRTNSMNRTFVRADTEDPYSQSFYSIYSFEKIIVIIDAHVQREFYEKYIEDIEHIREEFKFLKPFILENHVEEFKNNTFSYLYPKGWKPTKFVEATKDTGSVNGIRPWAMALLLNEDDREFPNFSFYTYDLSFYEWKRVHSRMPFLEILKNEHVIVSEEFLKRNRYFNNGKIAAWDFLYSWIIKENRLDMMTLVSFVRLKETNKIVVFVYDTIDIELNDHVKKDSLFRLGCIGESAESLIFATLTNTYEPYFANRFYLD